MEQPLPNSTSCNLGSINISEFITEDGKFDEHEFSKQVFRSVYYLDLVIDATKYPLDEIEGRTKNIRPIGLGIMGLADLAIKLNIKYGSEDFVLLCNKIGQIMAAYSLLGSIELAKYKNETYPEYKNITKDIFYSSLKYDIIVQDLENSKISYEYDTTKTNKNELKKIEELIDLNINKNNTKAIKVILNNIHEQMMLNINMPLTFKNALKAAYEIDYNCVLNLFKYGLRNSRRLSIAPTGTISLILNTSSSIEPNFAYEWTRTVTVNKDEKQDLKYYHKLYNEENKSKGLLLSASDLSPMQHVECVAEFAKWIDSGISKTVNLPFESTVDDVKEIYNYCFDNKIKGITIYRDGSRNNQPLVKNETKPEIEINSANEEDINMLQKNKPETYNSIRIRPKIMKGLTTKSDSPYGSIYVTANFDDNNKMFETFISAGKSGSVSKSVTEALSRVISLALRANVDINDIVKTISSISGSEIWIYDTVDGKEEYVKSIPDVAAKMLADLNKYSTDLITPVDTVKIKDKTDVVKADTDINKIHNKTCPECGSAMIMVSGCAVCMNCGYSPCK